MTSLRFRLPGRAQPLGAWLAALLPEIDRSARRRLVETGSVRLDGRVFDRPKQDCPAGSLVEIDWPASAFPANPAGAVMSAEWSALVETPPWPSGSLGVRSGATLDFESVERRGDLARLVLRGPACSGDAVCAGLAAASMPVVGDLVRGGLGVVGGPFLRATGKQADVEDFDWPGEPVWRGGSALTESDSESEADLDFQVSRETARALAAGHAWILPDDASDPATRDKPGALVRVIERGAGPIGWARIEGTPGLAARIWATGDIERRAIPSVESRVARALARRRSLLGDRQTNAYRLIHGEADGLPGLFVDRLGPLLRVLVSGWACVEIRERVIAALLAQIPVTPEGHSWSVLELLHLRSPGADQVDRVRWVVGGPEQLAEAGVEPTPGGFWVSERGLRFWVDPGWDAPRKPRPGFGLFVDQRENRERLAGSAADGRSWLNLFAHTGAFSVSLLAAGAERVASVDLSGPYLDRLEENLRANEGSGVDPARHESIRGEVRHYLDGLAPGETFHGIVIDPPTAAASGRRFWSVKQDLEPLLESTIGRLSDGGTLLVTQNRAGPALGLDRVLEALLARAGRPVARLDRAAAGPDHPSLVGFPEGDPFEGWCVTLR